MDISSKVEQLLPTLSIEEKVGQLFVMAFAGNDTKYALELIKEHHVGGFYITDDNASSKKEAHALSTALQRQAALRACDAPLLLGVDQEGAWGILVDETDLGPGNLALGQVDDPSVTENMYQVMAQQMKEVGYNTLLGPCSDINANPDNPIIGQRAFGESADKVSRHVYSAVKGIISTGNFACAKHFPGHGDTDKDSHQLLPVVDKTRSELDKQDLLPFATAINAGVQMIMTSHICFPQLDTEYPATLSRKILTDLLKKDMQFDGLIITDSMNMWAMRKNYSPVDAAILAIQAGAHLIMLSEEHYENQRTDYKELQVQTIQGVVEAVKSNQIEHKLVDEALHKVLCYRYKLLQQAHSPTFFAASDCQAIAQNAARDAIKTVRNDLELWPLPPTGFNLMFACDPQYYQRITNSRGIGPNDPRPASDIFVNQLHHQRTSFNQYSFQQLCELLQQKTTLPDELPIVLVTENYPLPGEDFGLEEQVKRVQKAIELWPKRLVVLALRSDYELRHYDGLSTYICTYSSRAASAAEVAKKLI